MALVAGSFFLTGCRPIAWPSAVAVSSQDGGRTVLIHWNGCGGLQSATLTDGDGKIVWRIVAWDHTSGTGVSLLALPIGAQPDEFKTEVPFSGRLDSAQYTVELRVLGGEPIYAPKMTFRPSDLRPGLFFAGDGRTYSSEAGFRSASSKTPCGPTEPAPSQASG